MMRRSNPAPRAWKVQRGSTRYPCKAKHLGKRIRRQGRPYDVTTCATPKRGTTVGQYWLTPEGQTEERGHAVPKPAVSRALAREKKGGPAADWRVRAIRTTPTVASVRVEAPDGTYLVELHRNGEVRVWRRDGDWVWVTAGRFRLGAFEWPEGLSEAFTEDDAPELERALLAAPPVRAFLGVERQRLRAGAFRQGAKPPVLTFAAARTAHALAGRAGCSKGRAKQETARLAALAEGVACDSLDGPVRSSACFELYDAFARGAPLTCEDRGRVPCNQAVSRARAEDLRSGAEPMAPLGPYETATPHTVGGSPCCWYHPDTQARLALRREVDARAGNLSETAYWEAVREAETSHPLDRAWEACDDRARREFGPKTEGFRDTFEEQVDRLVALRDQYRQGITPRPADLAAVGIDDDPDYAVRAVEDALAQARHERDVTHGRRGVKHAKVGRHRTNPPTCPKCGGKGRIRGFDHVDGGRCFQCSGAGTLTPRAARPTRHIARTTPEEILGSLRTVWKAAAERSPSERAEWARATDEDGSLLTAGWVGAGLALVGSEDRATVITAFQGLGLPQTWWGEVSRAEARTRRAAFDRVAAERGHGARGNPRGAKSEPPQIVGGKDGLFRVWVPSSGQWLGPFEDIESAEDAVVDANRPRRQTRSRGAPPESAPLELHAQETRRREVAPQPRPGTDPSVPYVHRSAAGVFYVWHPTHARFLGPFEQEPAAWDRMREVLAELRQGAAPRRASTTGDLFSQGSQPQRSLGLAEPTKRGQLGLFGNPGRSRRGR